MSLLTAVGVVLLGLVLLAGGGEILVRGAVSIARVAGMTPAVVGLTVVAMGTSLPELVVSLIAGLGGSPDLAVGNVVGSNIVNIGFVLGVAALLVRLPIAGTIVRLEWPFMFVASAVMVLLARDGWIDRLEGAFAVLGLALFTLYMIQLARGQVAETEQQALAAEVRALDLGERLRSLTVPVLAVLAGIGLLVAGGKALVDGAVVLARYAGWSERTIGLTVVAMGTSAPEVATSVIAAFRRHTDVAIANVLGSNLFNILGILGMVSLVRPIPIAPEILHADMVWMLGISLLLLPLMRLRFNLNRVEGGILLLAYGVYLATVLRHPQ